MLFLPSPRLLCRGEIRFPRDMYVGDTYTSSRRLVRELCEPNVLRRLGCLRRGALDVKDAPFFDGVRAAAGVCKLIGLGHFMAGALVVPWLDWNTLRCGIPQLAVGHACRVHLVKQGVIGREAGS